MRLLYKNYKEKYSKNNYRHKIYLKLLYSMLYFQKSVRLPSFINIDEAQALLASTGFILSKSSLFDVIIMFCIVKEIYDVFEIDSILFQYDQETLFSKE